MTLSLSCTRNAIPGGNSPSIQATVASYVGIDRQESAAGAVGNRYAVFRDLGPHNSRDCGGARRISTFRITDPRFRFGQ